MADTQQTQCRTEGLEDIFQRNRPSLPAEFLGKLSENYSREKSSIICVSGKSASGKSMFAMELMSRALLLPNEESPEVLLVNVDKSFNILKFMEIR